MGMKTRLFRQAVGDLISAERIFPPEHNPSTNTRTDEYRDGADRTEQEVPHLQWKALFNLMCSYALLHDLTRGPIDLRFANRVSRGIARLLAKAA
jgi:hypothetical protein